MREVFQAIQSKAENTHILVVGDVMLDEYVWGSVSHISPEAPVPVVDVSGTTYVLGGAANVANNLRQIGCNVSLMGVIGQDAAGDKILSLLNQVEIDSSGIVKLSSRSTTKKTRIMSHHQQLIRMDVEDKNTIPDAVANYFINHMRSNKVPHAIIFSDYDNGMYHPRFFKNLIKHDCFPTLVDPKGKRWERYYGATAITPNMEELSIAVGFDIPDHDRLEDAADAVYNLAKYQYLLVTQGKNGMTLFQVPWDEFSSTTIPIKDPRTVYDVSGAGDTVMAIFALGLALKQDPMATAELANLVAGIVVGKLGTATTTLEEIKDRLDAIEPATWQPRGKILSYQDLLKWNQNNKDKKTVAICECFDTLSKDIICTIQRYKSAGYVTFCYVYSHFNHKSFNTIEDRIEIASAIESVDFVIGLDDKFEGRSMKEFFDICVEPPCPIKRVEEIIRA